MSRKRFQGSRDPNAIILRNIFPMVGIHLFTPIFTNESDIHTVILEGGERDLRYIESHVGSVLDSEWKVGPHFDGDTKLFFYKELGRNRLNAIELPAFGMWYSLSENFVLSNRTRLQIMLEGSLIENIVCDLSSFSKRGDLLEIPSLELLRKNIRDSSPN